MQLLIFGKIPWISLSLAFSFGLYGLIRKTLSIDPIAGLAVETLFALPFALAFIIWSGTLGDLRFGIDRTTDVFLCFGGIVTVFPLLFFHCRCITTKPYDNRDAPIHRADNISTYRDFLFSRAVQFGERRCLWVYLDRAHCLLIRRTEKEK